MFEGDAAAELAQNPILRERLLAPTWPDSPRSALAWVGDAISIKDPTSALFRRQGGNHLLIVGQNDEAAIGVMIATLLSLASQYTIASSATVRFGARFFVLDGTPEDHPHSGVLAKVAGALPHGADVGDWRDVSRVLAEVGAELTSAPGVEVRRAGAVPVHPRSTAVPRPAAREDDFSFSKREDEASPTDHLDAILREGPLLGIHVIVWCDTVNNLNRYFAHQILREFEMRVLFQMSPTDSGHLLDSPLASKLGKHRALFFSEEQNRIEKFRPYGVPGDEWLEWVHGQLGNRMPRASGGGS